MVSQARSNGHGEPTTLNYQHLVSTLGDVTSVMDLDGRYLYCSAAFWLAFGWEPDELVGGTENDLVHPDDAVALLGGRSERALLGPVTTSYRFRCRDESYRWVETTSRRCLTVGPDLVVSTMRDITERQKLTAALELRASTDPLTGVANRTVLMDRLRQGLRRLGRSPGTVLAVLFLDLDRFKVINDSVGHHIGDEVLLKIAGRLTQHLRPADTLARLGGDEFVLVAEGITDMASAANLANRVIMDGRTPFVLNGEEFTCTMSIGVACTSDSQRNAGELLVEADLALHRAKDLGRDRVAMFDDELRTTAVDRLVTERMLRHALHDGRVVVEYQPIVDLTSGHTVGAEALVRVRDLEHRLRLPGSFLGVAEETGLLVAIDEVVLADAIKQASAWRLRLPARLRRRLHQCHGPPPGRQRLPPGGFRPTEDLRLTSGRPIDRSHRTGAYGSVQFGHDRPGPREIGVKVGLDDFGTRYSSLSYLRQFPLDFVKIDKSFIDDLVIDPKVRAITGAIIVLSHALDLTVVAEGVEFPSQRRILIDLDCDRAQGFFYAASGTPEQIDDLVLPRASFQ